MQFNPHCQSASTNLSIAISPGHRETACSIQKTKSSAPWESQRPIGTQAGHEEDSHSDSLRKYVLRHTSIITEHKSLLPIGRLAQNWVMAKTVTRICIGNTSCDIPPKNTDHNSPCHFSLPPSPPPASFLRRQES